MNHPAGLSAQSRYLILAAAFLGWMFSGFQMSVMNLASAPATESFYGSQTAASPAAASLTGVLPRGTKYVDPLKEVKARWYSYYNATFLFGAATGGLLFGWLGDRIGRVRAMGMSILCYSLFGGAGYFSHSAEQLLVLRFLSGMGVGGMWPTGVSLVAEAWADMSRPTLSGLLGTSANVGIVLLSAIVWQWPITPTSWRWILLVGATPALLGVLVLMTVPESPAWLATRSKLDKPAGSLLPLFSPPLLKLTLIGIALGTIPVLGGWGVTSWLIPWAADEQRKLGIVSSESPALAAIMRASGGALGSLFGGWIANMVGRRTTYFLISLTSFLLSEYIFLTLNPTMPGFSAAVFAVGCVSTVFFGWLPLYLPELFPTHVRATGAGISFNWGRILSAVGVLGTGALTAYMAGNYPKAGMVMSLIYAAGMIVILFAPDTTGKKLTES
jgi:MFS transporter, SHS family, sialic acid transporter